MKRTNGLLMVLAMVAATGCSEEQWRAIMAIRALVAAALQVSEEDLLVQAPPTDQGYLGDDPAVTLFLTECNDEAQDALNRDDGNFVIPTAPALPEPTGELPAACDEALRTTDLLERCGPLAATTATGTLAEALAGCSEGTTCHIQLPVGDFESAGANLGCVLLEGAGEDTRIHGTVNVSGPSIIARVAIDDGYGAVSPSADVLVTESLLVGGYEGLSVNGGDNNVAVCRSRVAGGYAGVGQSWQSSSLTVAQSAVAACYEAVATSWGSKNLHAQGNLLLAGYVGVHIHHSLATAVVGNIIYGDYEAVSVSQWEGAIAENDPSTPRIVGVYVSGNTILGGSMPTTDIENDIVIE